MRLNTATPFIALAVAPALTHGFHVASRPAPTGTSTSLAMRRSMVPVLRRGGFFQDIDRIFDEMDEIMESSLATRYPRPSLFLRELPKELNQRRPLGFEVTQGDTEYKMSVHVPNVQAKDIDLQLDNDGRVMRLKGEKIHDEGGMKVQSRFEKAILLPPDVDTENLSATMSGDTLVVVAPKVKEALDEVKTKKIDINIEEPKAVMNGIEEPKAVMNDIDEYSAEKAPTRLAVEKLKDEKAEVKRSVDIEKKWPANRDFPY